MFRLVEERLVCLRLVEERLVCLRLVEERLVCLRLVKERLVHDIPLVLSTCPFAKTSGFRCKTSKSVFVILTSPYANKDE